MKNSAAGYATALEDEKFNTETTETAEEPGLLSHSQPRGPLLIRATRESLARRRTTRATYEDVAPSRALSHRPRDRRRTTPFVRRRWRGAGDGERALLVALVDLLLRALSVGKSEGTTRRKVALVGGPSSDSMKWLVPIAARSR